MRIGNRDGRAVLIDPQGGAADVDRASGGRFGPDPQSLMEHWADFRHWADSWTGSGEPYDEASLLAPVPMPRQSIGIGRNYRAHAAEVGSELPTLPMAFGKFSTCVGPPSGDVVLYSEHVDWEVELVLVIGAETWQVDESHAWQHVAGVTVGQDISDRQVQFSGGINQLALAKSFPGYGRLGPTLVTVDELDDPDSLELRCELNGETVQHAKTSDLIFAVPELISRLSHHFRLLAGDVIWTGTPSGIGMARTPPRYLRAGDDLASFIEGVGAMHHTFVNESTTREDHR